MSQNTDLAYRPANTAAAQPSAFETLVADVKSDMDRAISRHQDFARRMQQQRGASSSDSQQMSQQLQDALMQEAERARSGQMAADEAERALGQLNIASRDVGGQNSYGQDPR